MPMVSETNGSTVVNSKKNDGRHSKTGRSDDDRNPDEPLRLAHLASHIILILDLASRIWIAVTHSLFCPRTT